MKTAKKILLGLIALCAALAFAGCNNSGGPVVLSSWYCETNSTTLEFYDNGTFLLKDSSGSSGGTYTGDSTANSGTLNVTILGQTVSFEIKSDSNGYYLEYLGVKFYREGSSAPSSREPLSGYYIRGDFDNWSGIALTHISGNTYKADHYCNNGNTANENRNS